jgi:arginyl-tRNA synthetase
MKTLQSLLMASFEEAIEAIYGSDYKSCHEVVTASSPQFGHYQFNGAMKLAKLLNAKPREIANRIQEDIQKRTGNFSTEIAGAGFINIRFTKEFLSLELEKMLRSSHFGLNTHHADTKVIVEFSSPNIAKELHVGHLRSTIIGESIARLFEFLGYDVLRLNHLGDWGTQFGMLIHYLKINEPDVIDGSKNADLTDLMTWYKKSKACFDTDEEFKKQAQLEVVALQGGDKVALKVWKRIVHISELAYQNIYHLLGVRLENRGESFYQPFLQEMVDLFHFKGLITVSGGAKCVFMDQFIGRDSEPLPLMIQKSDGGFNYDTTDIAAMWYRINHDKADRIICVTDGGQSLHFNLVEAACKKAGFFEKRNTRFDHVPFGLVLGADGKKFKTRSGDTEKLIDLLTESIDEAQKILLERMPELDDHERLKMAKILGVDAVKYSDLSTHRHKDYTFSYERMLKFEGNTAPFLLYSYVRALSIKRKIGLRRDEILEYSIHLEHESEVELALALRRFDEILKSYTEDLYPHRLCEYLYQLACLFNAFFRDCHVEGDSRQNSRLMLVELFINVFKKGLDILGLDTLEKM